MMILALTVKLYAPWVHSLKEKRMEVKSLLAKTKNKFNLSAAEVGEQDIHQVIQLGFAAIAADTAQADSIAESVLHFLEANTEAEITEVVREIR